VSSADAAGAPARRGGFTLIEMLIGMVLVALIAGFIFRFVIYEGRLVSLQAARQEALQNARMPLMLLSSELRAASPEGIISAQNDSLEMMVPRVSGLVCSVSGSTVVGIFPLLDDDVFTESTTTGVRIQHAARWLPGKSQALALVSDIGAPAAITGTPCENMRSYSDTIRTVRAVTITVGSGASPLSAATAGDLMYLYDVVRYDKATVTDATGTNTWLRRSYGVPGVSGSSQQPMAGPLSGGGFRLSYRQINGGLWSTATPGRDSTGISRIRSVTLTIVTTSKAAGKSIAVQADSATTTATLRN